MTDGVDLPDAMILLPVVLFGAAAVLALLSGKMKRFPAIASIVTAAGGVVATLIGVNALFGERVELQAGWPPAPGVDLDFRLGPLGAWFLIVIGVPAVAAGIFAIDYLAPSHLVGLHGPSRQWTDAAVGLFLASMSLLVVADGVYAFLIAWEAMAITSFFLVIGDGGNENHRRTGFVYLVMTHAGTAFIIAAFAILGRNAGSWNFADFRDAAPALARWEQSGVFMLALAGFGAKAGLIPLHIWLPRAHPAAPSHASALMSAVMVKTAIFGLIMVSFEFLAHPESWWGGLLIAAGAVSAVLGILYSLMERDIKRVLAYSTVENVGIIVIGVGAALLLRAEGYPQASALALVAALFHTFSHALFKSLLFLVAGAVQQAAGSRDLERLGGLIRGMPRTAVLALIGSASIAALPPLNGFAGEWMVIQSLLSIGSLTDRSAAGSGAALAVGAVGLTGALALVGFVRLFGMTFLAQPRTGAAHGASETSGLMQVAMAIPAVGCVVFGLLPMAATRLLRPVAETLAGERAVTIPRWTGALDSNAVSANYVPLLVAGGLALVGVLPWLLARWFGGPATERISPTWVCGIDLRPRMQYTATAFAKPLRLIFHALIRPERTVVIDRPVSAYVIGSIHYEESVKPVYERYLYEPFLKGMLAASHRVRALQSGSVRLYLTFFLVTLVVVIALAR